MWAKLKCHRNPATAADKACVDERGAVGISLKPAAAIVRQYGEQFRAPKRKQGATVAETAEAAMI
jgi:hypothetical protein